MLIILRRAALFALAFALLLPALALAGNNGNKGLIWKVEGKNCTVWLGGTIHFANQDMYPLPDAYEEAFAQAKVLGVEADITNMTDEDVQVLTQLAAYPPGDGLSKHVPASILMRFKEAGMDLTPFEQLKPWYAVMSSVALKLAGLGYNPDMGIDMHMLQRAHEKGMPIIELESIQAQFRLMAGLSEKDDKGFMQFMLTDIEKMDEQISILSNSWKRGDGDGMARELFASIGKNPNLRPFYDAMYFKRNRGMADKVAGYLESGQDHLILVGAGHLVGPKSVIELLEKKGFEPVQQ